ncbi:phage head-tail connector protein [Mammaliicoccus sciuri]|uniref:phage head-tail connector protein n=1 Tax=Mammaliicoccus sciuri TaxID=1296 RepID=UPI003791B3BA
MTNDNLLENVKIILGIKDNLQDDLLNLIINRSEQKLISYFPKDVIEVPERFQYIIEEVSIKRFNRIGAEGMTSESVDGRSNTFQDNDFDEYLPLIENFYKVSKNSRGKIGFII